MANFSKVVVIGGLALVVALAVTFSLSLGNPLGRAIGRDLFTHKKNAGPIQLAAASLRECSEDDLAATAAYAEQWSMALSAWISSPATPVSICLFDTKSDYQEGCTDHVPGFVKAMDWCYDPSTSTIWGWVMEPAEMRAHLRHELFHHAVRKIGGIPPWLEEGTAELLEGAELSSEGTLTVTALQRDRLKKSARRLASDPIHVLKNMSTLTRDDYRGKDRDLWYSLGYSASTWLASGNRLGKTVRGGTEVATTTALTDAQMPSFVCEPNRWREAIGRILDRPQTP